MFFGRKCSKITPKTFIKAFFAQTWIEVNPDKTAFLRRTASFGVFCVKIRGSYRQSEEAKKKKKTILMVSMGRRNSWLDRYKILHGIIYPRRIKCKLQWRSVRRFWSDEGRNFILLYRLASSPLYITLSLLCKCVCETDHLFLHCVRMLCYTL